MAYEICGRVPAGALVVLEGPAYSMQAQAGVHQRAGLWWLVADTLLDVSGCSAIEVSPSALKKLATGKGSGISKADMRMALFRRTGIDVRDDNQVDAFWLREVGLQLLEDPARLDLPALNRSVLAKVDPDGVA